MAYSGLDTRHRDKDGEVSRKHGDTKVATLRKIYGLEFAPGFEEGRTLRQILADLDETSLTKIVHHHDSGRLEKLINEYAPAKT